MMKPQVLFICVLLFKYVFLKSLNDDFKESLAFRLVHINDIHAHFDQINEILGRCNIQQANSNQCYGGVARLKTAVDQVRNLKPEMDSIFLNAGDYYQVSFILHFIKLYVYDVYKDTEFIFRGRFGTVFLNSSRC